MARNTVRELLPAVGAEVLVRFEALQVWMRVLDAKCSYGNERILVTPLNGRGEQWIELGIAVPPVAAIEVTAELLEQSPDARLMMGTRSLDYAAGTWSGSRYVVADPGQDAVYDFLPDSLIPRVSNVAQFAAVLVADKWLCNQDSRQCVFHRAGDGFAAAMVDHGYCFGGPRWDWCDAPILGLYSRPIVYADADFGLALEAVRRMRPAVIRAIVRDACATFGADPRSLAETIADRRKLTPKLLQASIERRPEYFGKAVN